MPPLTGRRRADNQRRPRGAHHERTSQPSAFTHVFRARNGESHYISLTRPLNGFAKRMTNYWLSQSFRFAKTSPNPQMRNRPPRTLGNKVVWRIRRGTSGEPLVCRLGIEKNPIWTTIRSVPSATSAQPLNLPNCMIDLTSFAFVQSDRIVLRSNSPN